MAAKQFDITLSCGCRWRTSGKVSTVFPCDAHQGAPSWFTFLTEIEQLSKQLGKIRDLVNVARTASDQDARASLEQISEELAKSHLQVA